MIFNQIFNAINVGIIILDTDLKVCDWNRWMEEHSGISTGQIKGSIIFDSFPELNNAKFLRSCKSVIAFGNFCFFSQKLHKYLFPFKSRSYTDAQFDYMQQSSSMGPIRDENGNITHIYISIQDVTEVATYEKKLLEMNSRDGLTGTFNRRYLENRLRDEFNRNKRYGPHFSLVMLDIDFFKKVNDEHGHLCGDFILKSVSTMIMSKIRNVDCFARYGGEEFCCLLPETPLQQAELVAERFRTAVMELENKFEGKSVKVTVSLGVAGLTEDITSPEMLIKKADDALYRAKREGRNKVVVMEQSGEAVGGKQQAVGSKQ